MIVLFFELCEQPELCHAEEVLFDIKKVAIRLLKSY